MNFYKHIPMYLQRSSTSCAVIYFAIMAALFITCYLLLTNLHLQYTSLVSAREQLEQLQSRSASHNIGDENTENHIGSPFLEGRTVTIAGAGLLQRVSKVITNTGGKIVSSQVNIQPNKSDPVFIGVIVACEIDQMKLQKMLFDLEDGMPFLFINQLEIQVSDSSVGPHTPIMRVFLTASSQWLGSQ